MKESFSVANLEVRSLFYFRILNKYIENKKSKILICGAGNLDKTIFEGSGFTNLTFSNLDARLEGGNFSPFNWIYANSEDLPFKNNEFDYVVEHASVHHSSIPHKFVTEMYRVAKMGVLVFENRDSVLLRLSEYFNITQKYELSAVFYNDCKFGGVNNSNIPNYVYRWNEREVEKLIRSYAPHTEPDIIFEYGVATNSVKILNRGIKIKSLILSLINPFYVLITKIFKKQGNLFCFFIRKEKIRENKHNWIQFINDQFVLDENIIRNKYKNRTK